MCIICSNVGHPTYARAGISLPAAASMFYYLLRYSVNLVNSAKLSIEHHLNRSLIIEEFNRNVKDSDSDQLKHFQIRTEELLELISFVELNLETKGENIHGIRNGLAGEYRFHGFDHGAFMNAIKTILYPDGEKKEVDLFQKVLGDFPKTGNNFREAFIQLTMELGRHPLFQSEQWRLFRENMANIHVLDLEQRKHYETNERNRLDILWEGQFKMFVMTISKSSKSVRDVVATTMVNVLQFIDSDHDKAIDELLTLLARLEKQFFSKSTEPWSIPDQLNALGALINLQELLSTIKETGKVTLAQKEQIKNLKSALN